MIARIVTNSKNVETLGFVTVSPDTNNIDVSKPTLIIGKKKAEELFGKENVKMLDRHITGNVMWTYAKTDRRDEYERDIEKFNKLVVKYIEDGVKYRSFNVCSEPYERLRCFMKFIKNDKNKYIYVTFKQLYIYCDGVVVGVSLEEIGYRGIPRNKVLDKVFSNPHNIRVENTYMKGDLLRKMSRKANYIVPYLSYLEG